MQYFDSLPKVVYTDQNGISTIRTNLLARVSIIPQVLKDPMLYYQYEPSTKTLKKLQLDKVIDGKEIVDYFLTDELSKPKEKPKSSYNYGDE